MRGENDLDIIGEIGLIFGVCLAGEGIAAILPVDFPASVISMILLIVLLMTGVVKTRHIQRVSGFLTANMAFVFLPSCVGIMEHADVLLPKIVPIFLICFLTTPLIYLATAWTVQGMMALRRRKERSHA